MRVRFWLASMGVAAVLAAGAASADVVRLRNGDILEGKAADLGESVRVTTAEGTLELPWASVEVVDLERTAAEVLAEKRAAVPAGDAKALFAVGLWAERQGLFAEAREVFGAVVALDGDHAAAREALGEGRTAEGWKKGADLLRSRGFVLHDGRWMLAAEADAAKRAADASRKVTEEEKRAAGLLVSLADPNPRVRGFAEEALASVDPALRRRLFLVGMRHRAGTVRLASARGLALKGDEGVVRPLVRAAILDEDAAVREAAVGALRGVDIPDTVHPFMRALYSDNARTRTYAGEALGRLGNRVSVETLIRRVHWVAGPSNRANIQVLNQISYIRDFDVEIAQLAQIGDPIIGILQDGIVLDAKVYGAQGWDTEVERRTYVQALQTLTGQTFGGDLAAWRKWWEDEGKREYGRTAAAMAEDPDSLYR